MDWNDYQLILAIVREKTIRGAARLLGVNHATVSRRLTHLNRGPGGPLIRKSPSGLWPTKMGEAVIKAAEKMEKAATEASRHKRAIEQRFSGPLSISVPVLFLQHVLFEDVARFTKQFPNIDLTIDATDSFVDLDRAEADIVIRASDAPPDHWVGRRLFPYALSLYAHKDYLAGNSAKDLKWIAPPGDSERWSAWMEESPYPEAPIGLRVTGIAGRFAGLKEGIGMGRAACFMADPDIDLVRLPGAPVVEAEPFWLLSHPDFADTDRAKAAIKFFAAAIQSQQPLLQGYT